MGSLLMRPIGVAAAAPLANTIGLSHTFLVLALLSAFVVTVMLAFPAVWKMEFSEDS
jgi:hypothetical protein